MKYAGRPNWRRIFRENTKAHPSEGILTSCSCCVLLLCCSSDVEIVVRVLLVFAVRGGVVFFLK